MPDDPHRSHDTDPLAETQSPDTIESGKGGEKRRAVHVGDVLGRYELVEEVGEGGMATVYRARDRELRREVAIKVLFPHLARRDEVVRRFHREARAAAGLEHPNILRVYDVGGAEGPEPPYIVMELIRGHSLLNEIELHGPMLSEVAACIGALLADALAVAHEAGIIHRDVKPANVLIAPGGRLLLADFGVARLETEDSSLVTKTGSVLGTPAYMSPEQASGDTATAKSDLYSLGATLYQLSTGSLPYSGSPARVLSQIAQGALVPAVRRRSAVGPDLSRVIDRLMAFEATARPTKAAEVAAELRQISANGGLGDPVEELAAYFADPELFVADRLPKVVSALVKTGERAVAQDKLPRAMALADRASALAPDDPGVVALVHTVTEGGKASRRRRVIALSGVGVLIAGGATYGVLTYLDREAQVIDAGVVATSDAQVIAAAADAAVADVPAGDARPIDAAVVDAAAPRPDARQRVDAAVLPAHDAGRRDAAITIDAPVAPAIDAAIAVDAGASKGFIVVNNDTWCEISIDGMSHGDKRKKAIAVDPGRHTVVCEQPNLNNRWEKTADVVAGQTVTLTGTMLNLITFTLTVDAKVNGVDYRSGTTGKLRAGRYELVIEGHKTYIDLKHPCLIKATPEPGCY